MINNELAGGSWGGPSFVLFADFCGGSISTVVDFKLPMGSHPACRIPEDVRNQYVLAPATHCKTV